MITDRRSLIPPEHLEHARTFRLPAQPPTRLNGNVQAVGSPDPYHQIFRGPVVAPVLSVSQAREIAASNGLRLPRAYARSGASRALDFMESTKRNSVLNLLGALVSYRALTNNQAAALTGDNSYAELRKDLVPALFRSGLIHLSPAHLDHGLGSIGRGAAVYGLGDPQRLRELLDHLTLSEWFAVTGNRRLPTSKVNVRHDVLATELALRASRLSWVATVLGPHFSTFHNPYERPVPRVRQGGPDLIIVAKNGLKIAVEITASIGQGFHSKGVHAGKVERWVRWLSEHHFETSGVVVVFLAAPSIDDQRARGDWPRAEIYRAVARAVGEYPGSVLDPTGLRMGVATWREWFPEAHLASNRFVRLRVDRPTGQTSLWDESDLLGPNGLSPAGRVADRHRAFVRNTALLSQTPPWIRVAHRPLDLAADLLRAAAGPVPTIAPLRSGSTTREPGAGQGAAADTNLPRRTLGATGEELAEHHRVTTPARPLEDWPFPRPAIRRRRAPTTKETTNE